MNNKPMPTGKYAVGTKTFTIYNTRKEALDTKGDSMRHIPARIYYPTSKNTTEGLTKAKSLSRSEAMGIKKIFMDPLNYDKMEAAGENDSECYDDAPFIEDKKFPLIVFPLFDLAVPQTLNWYSVFGFSPVTVFLFVVFPVLPPYVHAPPSVL